MWRTRAFRGCSSNPFFGTHGAPHKAVILILLLFLSACSEELQTGPEEIRWDREICPRCAMVVSDPKFAAQIRRMPAGGPEDKKGKSELFKFDDLGCAVIWLDERPWKEEANIQIWVTDYQTGDWIDARTASYVTGLRSPMAYGLGAQPDKIPGVLNFSEAKTHIYEVEARYNLHDGVIHTTPVDTK